MALKIAHFVKNRECGRGYRALPAQPATASAEDSRRDFILERTDASSHGNDVRVALADAEGGDGRSPRRALAPARSAKHVDDTPHSGASVTILSLVQHRIHITIRHALVAAQSARAHTRDNTFCFLLARPLSRSLASSQMAAVKTDRLLRDLTTNIDSTTDKISPLSHYMRLADPKACSKVSPLHVSIVVVPRRPRLRPFSPLPTSSRKIHCASPATLAHDVCARAA